MMRRIAIGVLLAVTLLVVAADFIAPASYQMQFREAPNAAPSRQHLLGTDDLGRDQFSRLLYGMRVSLVLAPAAALLATAIAALIGGAAGLLGGIPERFAMTTADLFLSLPWLFVLITMRALLPLNVSPIASVIVTFALLGILGWAGSARVICATTKKLRESGFVMHARAAGIEGPRLFFVHLLPNLAPLLWAQFLIAVPVFILTEANLGILGLGVSEPLPSWGTQLKQLEGMLGMRAEPWKFVPLVLLVIVVTSFEYVVKAEES
jgi:peptide/nickel transport system permease protein